MSLAPEFDSPCPTISFLRKSQQKIKISSLHGFQLGHGTAQDPRGCRRAHHRHMPVEILRLHTLLRAPKLGRLDLGLHLLDTLAMAALLKLEELLLKRTQLHVAVETTGVELTIVGFHDPCEGRSQRS